MTCVPQDRMAWAGGPATPSCALKSGPQNWAHMEHQPRAPDETARCLHSEQGSPATSGSQQLSPRREALGSRGSPAPAPPPPPAPAGSSWSSRIRSSRGRPLTCSQPPPWPPTRAVQKTPLVLANSRSQGLGSRPHLPASRAGLLCPQGVLTKSFLSPAADADELRRDVSPRHPPTQL